MCFGEFMHETEFQINLINSLNDIQSIILIYYEMCYKSKMNYNKYQTN